MSLTSAMVALEKIVDTYVVNGTDKTVLELCLELQIRAEKAQTDLDYLLTLVRTEDTKKANIKLPKLELPKFNGNVTQWISFWDRFATNVHNSSNLQDAEKLAYLVGCLEGEALQAIEGLPTSNANYKIAVDTLSRRFGKPNALVDAHYKELYALPCASEETKECRNTLDNIEKHLRILESLDEDTYLNHIRVLILSKFPQKVLYEIKLRSASEDVGTTRKALERIVTAMESTVPSLPTTVKNSQADNTPSEPASTTGALHVQSRSSFRGGRRSKSSTRGGSYSGTGIRNAESRNPKRPNQSKERGSFKKPKLSCIFCDNSHFNDLCEKYTLDERKNIIKTSGRCFICFGKNHISKDCTKKKLCRKCQKDTHNRALCPAKPADQGKSSRLHSTERDERSYCFSNYVSCLQTATVKISNRNRIEHKCRLLLDSGSQRSYITKRLADKLKLETKTEDRLLIYTFGSDAPKEMLSPSAIISILTKRGIQKRIKVNIVPHITDRIIVQKAIPSFSADIMADDDSVGEGIDMLIGNDYYFSFMKNETVKIKENLYIVNTEFGWIVSGNQDTTHVNYNALSVITYCQCVDPDCMYFTEPDLPLKDMDLKFLWSLESIGITDSPKVTREEEAVKHFNETVKYEDHRYQVKWPWIVYPPELPTNFGLAYGRLKGLIQRSSPELLQEYQNILNEQLQTGIIEIIEPQRDIVHQTEPPIHYLPHHMIKQEGKRGRIVYDASAKVRDQKSLNECMYRGPSMISDLTALIIQFRLHKVGITADVEKAFLQLSLQEEDRDVTRFLWVKDTSKPLSQDNVVHMRFQRVAFGIISSPFLLMATLKYHMSTRSSELLNKIANKCYVDNLVTGADSDSEAFKMYKEGREVFEELAMNLRDWNSNNKAFMNLIPDEHKSKNKEQEKILGMVWNLKEDTMNLKIRDNVLDAAKEVRSKREVLSKVASLYDPCGLASPLILPAKLLLQETWKRKCTWTTELPEDLKQKWELIAEDLKAMKHIKVPRYVSLSPAESKVFHELHCFTDASKNAHAAAVYLRTYDENETQIKVHLIMSKSRVNPVNDKSNLQIPRLELLGFFIGNKLISYVKEAMHILAIDKQYLWTDSLIVLNWMKSNKLLDPFVARRVNDIKKNRDLETCYISGDSNPADLATRPELWSQKKELWFQGPPFLSREKSAWPKTMNLSYHTTTCVARESLDDTQANPETGQQVIELMDTTVSDLPADATHTQDQTVNELRKVQREHFFDEVMGKKTHLSRNLGLYVDVDGVLRCRGRMANTDWSYEKKHPAIIPKDCDFTKKIIQETHEKNYHVGVSHTLAITRQNFWIPQGRSQVQKVLKRCPRCIKQSGGPFKLPPTPALPAERVNYRAPFTFTGIDYFGPLYVDTDTGKEKRWVCLLTCLAVRAVHMEVVKDLTADECLLALRRFIASRGAPELIVSDNATHFKLISEVLSSKYCTENKIKWKFIAQLAPWQGGFYERMISLVKMAMLKSLSQKLLRDSQLLTVVKEIEAVLNTRPLTCVGTEIEHVLKPADFLTLGKCVTIEPATSYQEEYAGGTATKRALIDSWKKGLKIMSEFKKMFTDHYLTSLREKFNYSPKQPRVTCRREPKVSEIVQIKEDTKNRDNWKVGKITSLLRGPDGECRVAKVQVGNSEFTRSIAHLYPLEIDEPRVETTETSTTENGEFQTGPPSPERDSLNVDVLRERRNSIGNLETVTSLDRKSPSESDLIEERLTQESQEMELELDRTEEVQGERADYDEPERGDESEREDSLNERPQRRAAAIRAREKIAELTRHLFALL